MKLQGSREIAEGTMAFYFEKPKGFSFEPGQFSTLTLLHPPQTDVEGDSRTFSIASAPHEPDLMFATRMRDTSFKRVLKSLAAGTEVDLDGPYGHLTLHKDAARPAVFLAGGIGITPFRSIITDAARRALPHHMILFYSNRRPEDAAFLDELVAGEKINPRYKFVGTMAEMKKSRQPWNGERGFISREMLARHIENLAAPVYYTAGPPAMVAAMEKMLRAAGVAGDDIRMERFSGY